MSLGLRPNTYNTNITFKKTPLPKYAHCYFVLTPKFPPFSHINNAKRLLLQGFQYARYS
ncbi:hypothetical protein E2542_SST29528 [Spatholobus suberectus]|nr:hypothetical protein E2542_SST29528 [Spatholobus suberectus]